MLYFLYILFMLLTCRKRLNNGFAAVTAKACISWNSNSNGILPIGFQVLKRCWKLLIGGIYFYFGHHVFRLFLNKLICGAYIVWFESIFNFLICYNAIFILWFFETKWHAINLNIIYHRLSRSWWLCNSKTYFVFRENNYIQYYKTAIQDCLFTMD